MRILRHIRKEFDFQTYVESNLPVKYAGNGELRICCPSCDDQKYKCYVNNEKKYFNCFKCDFRTGNFDVFDFVGVVEGITRGKAMLKLAHEYRPTTPDWAELEDHIVDEDEPTEAPALRTISSLPNACKRLTGANMAEERPFWEYLLHRGLTSKEVFAINTHYVPQRVMSLRDENGKRRGDIGRRVVIPVYGPDGSLVSWYARTIGDAEPKYFNCPDSDISRVLWPYARPKGNKVILVEGALDALGVRRGGYYAYATSGKKISIDQIDLLKQWGVAEVVLFWDRDAVRATVKAVQDLRMHFTVKVVDHRGWPKDRDPGDCLWDKGLEGRLPLVVEDPIDIDSVDFALWQVDTVG